MYCSNCGLNIDQNKLDKTLEKDVKNANNIKYLASSLISAKKYSAKVELADIKFNDKKNYKTRKAEINENLKKEIAEINERLNANDLEYFKNTLKISESRTANTTDFYVCPRCGKLVRINLDEYDIKSLARASHSEIHRGRNNISSGMSGLMIGIILAVIGLMFFLLSFKATNGGVLDTTCVEFYVFIVLLVLGIGLIIYALINITYGKKKIRNYENLLKDINNGAFHQ